MKDLKSVLAQIFPFHNKPEGWFKKPRIVLILIEICKYET